MTKGRGHFNYIDARDPIVDEAIEYPVEGVLKKRQDEEVSNSSCFRLDTHSTLVRETSITMSSGRTMGPKTTHGSGRICELLRNTLLISAKATLQDGLRPIYLLAYAQPQTWMRKQYVDGIFHSRVLPNVSDAFCDHSIMFLIIFRA